MTRTRSPAEACYFGWQESLALLAKPVEAGNHFHPVVETPRANLVAGMRWLPGVYTKRFNIRQELLAAASERVGLSHHRSTQLQPSSNCRCVNGEDLPEPCECGRRGRRRRDS